jgi:hypothetical protein
LPTSPICFLLSYVRAEQRYAHFFSIPPLKGEQMRDLHQLSLGEEMRDMPLLSLV